ncbi:Cys-tRNA(Pro)/Cys-tRNA(Cys) deacylase [Actinoalloteichus hoggarensis]|uniref:Cys-tRNA(Pro)/Cys-tRNA(Cys) deacylase n=1 Tax=Actinoalloteichus hoggarensis TaxID=1470176 RepID=A0A221W950_9PSEU|nr:Cys-tRNA(Pro) deacylase [Actinoalloteichus hoggarensis]ASO22478.1 Cys-tRNA(Pro)/Cys-tRNA(Cys) deacylase YbaK [Actinoalloteichus hoggarensis]MBB5923098.1 Cys-tRNA(Pro)/Cys-tRNA(Cys) deacylase [Actinoalloteichus hoggarensis]
MAGRGTPATALLVTRSIEHRVRAYEHDPKHASYGTEAVELLGQDAGRVFKTLVANLDGRLVVGVVPVSRQLDLKALAAALGGKKARMAAIPEAERATGYVAGGISPLGQRKALPLALDVSAVDHPTIFCSGGRRGLEIELAPADLVALTRAVVAPIAA